MACFAGSGYRGAVDEGWRAAGVGGCRGVPWGQRRSGVRSCAGETGDGHVPEGYPSCGLPPHPGHAAQVESATTSPLLTNTSGIQHALMTQQAHHHAWIAFLGLSCSCSIPAGNAKWHT